MIPVESTPDTVWCRSWPRGSPASPAPRSPSAAAASLLGCLPPPALYAGALYVVGPNASRAGADVRLRGLVASALAATPHHSRDLGVVVALSRLDDVLSNHNSKIGGVRDGALRAAGWSGRPPG
jgi:hypothetical protein